MPWRSKKCNFPGIFTTGCVGRCHANNLLTWYLQSDTSPIKWPLMSKERIWLQNTSPIPWSLMSKERIWLQNVPVFLAVRSNNNKKTSLPTINQGEGKEVRELSWSRPGLLHAFWGNLQIWTSFFYTQTLEYVVSLCSLAPLARHTDDGRHKHHS